MPRRKHKGCGLGSAPGDVRRAIDDCIGSKSECIVTVLESAAQSARETADHVASNWQDRKMARAWTGIANDIDRTAQRVKGKLPF